MMVYYCVSDHQENMYHVNNLFHQVQQQLPVLLLEPLETEPSCSLLQTFLYRSIIAVAPRGKCFARTWSSCLPAEPLCDPLRSSFWQTTDISSVLGDDSGFEYVAKAIWWILLELRKNRDVLQWSRSRMRRDSYY